MSNTNISTYATTDCGNSCWSTAAGTAGTSCTACDSLCTAICASSCTTACDNLCMDDCRVTCAGECGKTCEGTCSGFCRDDCTGCGATCAVNCDVGCGGECSTGCGGECGGSCGAGCGGACAWGCGTDCTGDCSSTCLWSCSGTSASTDAILSLSGRRQKFDWNLTNLTNPFNGDSLPFTSEYFTSAGITDNKFTVGDAQSISGIICQVNGGSTLSGTRTYPAGTYTFYGFVQMAINGLYYPAGNATVTIKPDGTFTWTYSGVNTNTGAVILGEQKQQGLGVYVSASEWNDLIDCVNDVTGSNISYVQKGDTISASTINAVANALGVSTVQSQSPIKASTFNSLMDAVNSLKAI